MERMFESGVFTFRTNSRGEIGAVVIGPSYAEITQGMTKEEIEGGKLSAFHLSRLDPQRG